MIESLINLDQIEKRPSLTFIWAFLVNSIAIIAAIQIQSLPGIGTGTFAVIFTIIPSVYFIVLLIRREERREEEQIKAGKISFWKLHGKDIVMILFYFFGVTMSFAVWSFALPVDTFDLQTVKINEIRGIGAATLTGPFMDIFMNNLQVMIVAFIFSLIFGAGAVFILVWNASILGVFIGQFSKSAWEIPLVSLGFLPHGIPEIGGYVVAALAGGILSVAILRKREDILPSVLIDAAKLLILGIALIALGAAVEVVL